jgi:SAM-dependent methyltransferase
MWPASPSAAGTVLWRESGVLACPACRAAWAGSFDQPESRCTHCGLAVAAPDGIPVLLRDPEAVRDRIDASRRSAKQEWFEATQLNQWQGPYRHHLTKRRSYVEGVIRASLERRPGPAIGLDLGCGDGANLVWLSGLLKPLYGSDYNVLRLTRARVACPDARLFLGDVTDYSAVDDAFDVILINHVLEHIPDDMRALGEVRRILRPGGTLVLGVPNEGAAFWQLAYRLQPRTLETSDHCHFYTALSIGEKCEAAGLRVTAVHPMGWGLPHWSLDAYLRGYQWVDDLLERVGRRLLPSQATSLYLIASK